jgi:hypothetical protein
MTFSVASEVASIATSNRLPSSSSRLAFEQAISFALDYLGQVSDPAVLAKRGELQRLTDERATARDGCD